MSLETSNLEQTRQELVDPRAISLMVDPEGRRETVQTILESRSRRADTREEIGGRKARVEELHKLTDEFSHEREFKLTKELALRQASLPFKIREIIGLADRKASLLKGEVVEMTSARHKLYVESYEVERELEVLEQIQSELPDPREQLVAYYEKMRDTPLSNEQKRELLKPEVLDSLSTEEYIALWRRLNPHFLAHVTRQGFRDHTGGDVMVAHNSGYHEFINGFVDVMGNGRSIFPPLARIGLVNRDEETVKSFVSNFLPVATSADQAKYTFLNFLDIGLASAPKYPDITATHLAAQMVSDGYYGGERGNEVFFVYPADVLASQYAFAFNGWEKDFTRPQSETKWNDVFIWTDPTHPGIPVDSGIVFLAEKTPVDPETGSKYASEIVIIDGHEKRVMIEDATLVDSFVEWGKKIDDRSPLKLAFTAYRNEWNSEWNDKRNYDRRQDLKEYCFTAFVRELQGLGFATDASSALASKLIEEMYWRDSFDTEMLEGIVKNSGAHLKRAESTIPAKEYWESFFLANPHLRPKHIWYYDGDPTTAVLMFQQQNKIGRADTSDTEGQLLGFDDRHVVDMGTDSRANAGYAELVEVANKIIIEHYGANS